MTYINAEDLRKRLSEMLNSTIKYGEIIKVNTKEGNAVIISEEEYNGLLATLELCSNQKLKEKIFAGKEEKIEDCTVIG